MCLENTVCLNDANVKKYICKRMFFLFYFLYPYRRKYQSHPVCYAFRFATGNIRIITLKALRPVYKLGVKCSLIRKRSVDGKCCVAGVL